MSRLRLCCHISKLYWPGLTVKLPGVITVSGYFLDPTEKPTDSINNAIAKTGESYNPLMALSFLTAGAALVLFRRKLRSAGDNEEA